MAKKPVIEDTLDSVTEIEEALPEPASIPDAPGEVMDAFKAQFAAIGYSIIPTAELEEMQRNLKMAR